MKNKPNIKVGDNIRTSQYPWQNESFKVQVIRDIKPIRSICCINLKTNQWVNLIETFCIAPKKTGFQAFSNLQIIKLTKNGNKEAKKEFIRRFKKLPKF